jgi:hypothetical protein
MLGKGMLPSFVMAQVLVIASGASSPAPWQRMAAK